MPKKFPAPWQIERLSAAHERKAFSCGDTALDRFLQKYVGQYEKKDMGRTFVAVLPGQAAVLGYYTLSAGAVDLELLPEEYRRKLPRHPVPVVHLGRLAVDRSQQGQGLGETLLLDALQRANGLSNELGIQAVEVHALDENARNFYLRYGFISLEHDRFHLYLSMKVVRRLSL